MTEQTMTVKELSIFFGRDTETIRRNLKNLCGTDFKSGVKTKITKNEVCILAEKFYKGSPEIIKSAIDTAFKTPANAEVKTPANAEVTTFTERELSLLSYTIATTVKIMLDNQEKKSSAITTHSQATQQLLRPAPQLDTRSQITKVIRDYAHSTGLDHHSCWTQLYNDYNLRTHSNVRILAKNRGVAPIDYLDDINQLEVLLAIATEMFPL